MMRSETQNQVWFQAHQIDQQVYEQVADQVHQALEAQL